jgi:hypothetical protein
MLDIRRIIALQEACVTRWHEEPLDYPGEGLLAVVCRHLGFNFLLWHEEDLARLREQLDRTDTSDEHRERVGQKLYIATLQHDDLARSAQQSADDLLAGRKRHQTYRQLKMYNDPTLNPYLYQPAATIS